MNRIIDITLSLDENIPVWPDSEGLRFRDSLTLEAGDSANVTVVCCDVHTGTHLDAPRHFIANGKTIEMYPPEVFVGPAYVTHLPGLSRITADDLEKSEIPPDVSRLLIRTDNSDQRRYRAFESGYTYLTPDAAEWVVERGCRLLGFDYLSIEQYGSPPLAHLALMRADVVILEGIDLFRAAYGWYELFCLPLRLVGREGSPVRAILRSFRSKA